MDGTLKVAKSKKNGRLVASIVLLVLSLLAFTFYSIFFGAGQDLLHSAKDNDNKETTETTDTTGAETENNAENDGGEALGKAIGTVFGLIFIIVFMIIFGLADIILNIAGLTASASVIKAARTIKVPEIDLPADSAEGPVFEGSETVEPVAAAPAKTANGRLIYGIIATALSALMIVLTVVFFVITIKG